MNERMDPAPKARRAPRLAGRSWVPSGSEALIADLALQCAAIDFAAIDLAIHDLAEESRQIHDVECVNLNPATNVMNPRAEALLSSGIGTRPSLGYPGDKYEMGLEAIEQIEVLAAELVAEVFDAPYVEIRVASGAMANLYAFLAAAEPGDAIIVPPAGIGGHVTHNTAGAAGLRGLVIHEAPTDDLRYTIDVDRLRAMAHEVRPKMITVGSSLNLCHHPVREIREIADEVGAAVLFDAAHLSGLIAGGAWPNPLHEGAHMMTMSTYKSLGGPPSGVIVTNDAALAERLDAIAYPGLTANFDVAKSAALAITMLDWLAHGSDYASTMVANARTLALALADRNLPVVRSATGATESHAFALNMASYGGGHTVARGLRRSNVLTSAIGLPFDDGAGLRVGTTEITRWGAMPDDMSSLADLIARAFTDNPESVAADVTEWRSRFTEIHYTREGIVPGGSADRRGSAEPVG
ncbi:MAG TPA: aminotransferase class I/II-fold pyridoxal phosphate-dependent enzyme [Ilumatobacter sp.]|nr:aminotransferase class I/II-fold pyridoxal phosphate-dependent enzyme [Ilumatobacter sp.]